MTPLEALHSFDHWIQVEFADQFKIIEKALKDSEKTDKYYAKLLESVLNDKEHKALEIIKDIFDFDFIQIKIDNTILYNMRMTNKITHYVQNIDIKTKEQFDLLKEVLK